MEPATPPRRPDGAQETGHTHPADRRGPVDRRHPHGGQMGPRGPATSPRRPDLAQETNHAFTVARQGPGDRPRPHGGHT